MSINRTRSLGDGVVRGVIGTIAAIDAAIVGTFCIAAVGTIVTARRASRTGAAVFTVVAASRTCCASAVAFAIIAAAVAFGWFRVFCA